MTMSREEALAELSALRGRRQAYAAGVANPSPDRQHAFRDAALLEAVLAALSSPASFEKGSPLPDAVKALALAGRKLDAIRVLRNEFGIGLLLAKDAVEAFVATERLKADARLLYAMAVDDGETWDLSDNDQAACNAGGDAILALLRVAPATPAPVAAPPADLVALLARAQSADAAWKLDGRLFGPKYALRNTLIDALLAFPLPEVPK